MKTIKLFLTSLVLTFGLASSAWAGPGALLGVQIGDPDIFFQSIGSQGVTYDAGTGAYSIESTPVFLTFYSGGAQEFIIGGNLTLNAVIDNTGALVSGSYSISGTSTDSVTNVTYGGVLLAGDVLDYGIIKTGTVNALSDYLLTVDSGTVVSLFTPVGSQAGMVVAHEGSTYNDSFEVSWSSTAKGNVGPVPDVPEIDPNAHTIGYWKNHPEAWPVDNLTICGENLDQAELISILETPVRGDKTISMAHQLIAGLLGGAGGFCGSLTADAETWLCDHGGIGASRNKWDGGELLKNDLDDYNNGDGC